MYPNFRHTVEVIIVQEGRVLVMKRSEAARIAPGVWHVPAGKAKYEETPREAAIREALEETGLAVEIVEEASVRAFHSVDVHGERYDRCIFTYVVKPLGEVEVTLNDEHSAFAWVEPQQLLQPPYESFDAHLQGIVAKAIQKGRTV